MQARLFSRDVRNRCPYERVFLHFFDFKNPNELVLQVKVEELSNHQKSELYGSSYGDVEMPPAI